MSSPPRRPRKDQQRNRQALLDAAFRVFGQLGIDAPLDTVAKHAGVSNATLYRHFPTRRGLIIVILLDSLERNAVALERAAAQPSAWGGLRGYLSWLFAEQVQNPMHLSAMRAVPAGTNVDVDRLRDAAHGDLKLLMAGAQSEGAMRADRWIEDLYIVLLLNESFVGARLEAPEVASRRFLDLVLDAFAVHPSGSGSEAGAAPESIAILGATLARELAGLPDPPIAP